MAGSYCVSATCSIFETVTDYDELQCQFDVIFYVSFPNFFPTVKLKRFHQVWFYQFMGCKYVITMIYSQILHDHSLAGLPSVLRGKSTTLHFSFSHVSYVCSMKIAIDVSEHGSVLCKYVILVPLKLRSSRVLLVRTRVLSSSFDRTSI